MSQAVGTVIDGVVQYFLHNNLGTKKNTVRNDEDNILAHADALRIEV